MRLQSKVAVVTGGAKGQGAEAARLFAQEGARVVIADVLEDQGRKTEAVINEGGGKAAFFLTDVSQPQRVKALVDFAVRTFGALHVLYNNAGIPPRYGTLLTDLEEADWHRVLDVNLKGPWLCAKYAIPHMVKAGGGSIINTSSTGGIRGTTGTGSYGPSKAGLISLTQTIAAEFSPRNIRCNAILPGIIRTDFNAQFRPTPEAEERSAKALVPLGRLGDVGEVARLALFLASDESSYITGAVIPVDGGQTIRY